MKISKDEIIQLLAYVTVGYFDEENVPPPTVEGYADQVRSLRLAAEHQGDLPWLKLALEHVLLHPEQDWSELAGPRYPFNSREMVQMIDYIYKTIWPDAKLPDSRSAPDVELVPMSFEEWRRHRATLPQPA